MRKERHQSHGRGEDWAENEKGKEEGGEDGKMALQGSEFHFPAFILG